MNRSMRTMLATRRLSLPGLLLSILLYFVASLLPPPASAQTPPATGTPPFGSFGGGPDIINLANLNAHWTIPIRHKPGRGNNFNYDLTYDSSVWMPVTSGSTTTWQPISAAPLTGWQGLTSAGNAKITYSVSYSYGTCGQSGNYTWQTWNYTNFIFYDALGVASNPGMSGVQTVSTSQQQCPPTAIYPSAPWTASFGVGSTVYVTPNQGSANASVVDKNGITTYPAMNGNPPPGTTWSIDSNANKISLNSGVYTDTLNTIVLSVGGTAPSNTGLSYTAPSGVSAAYVVSYKSYTVATNFASGTIHEYGATATSLVDRVTLPDASYYQFAYEHTPSTQPLGPCTPLPGTDQTACVTARIVSVTLPTGGQITYAYSGGSCTNNSGILSDGSAACIIRTTPDGTWTYDRSGTIPTTTTTITAPKLSYDTVGNQTVIQFNGIYEIQRQTYQGSSSGTLLQAVNTCYYVNNGTTCLTSGVAPPITQRNVSPQFGSTGLKSLRVEKYQGLGYLIEQDDYDYANGTPTVLLRKVLTTYAGFNCGPVVKPSLLTIQDGSGSIKAQTTLTYDQGTTTASSGTPQHGTPGCPLPAPGNLTTVATLVQGSTTLNKTFTYYDTGMLKTATDVNGAQSVYNYPNATTTCGNAFPTSITEPVGSLSRAMTWNCNGAVQLTAVDENNKTTTTAYATDPYNWRPDSVTDPASAVVNFCYGLLSSSTGTCTRNTSQVESTLNFNSNNSTVDSLATIDSLGRLRVGQTRQSPTTTNFDSGETDYDALGRPSRGTLPYSGTAGQLNSGGPAVTKTYDALGRPHVVTDAGGGTLTYSYPQNDVYISVGPAPTGEHTKDRQLQYNGLGKLVSVCEITSVSPSGNCGQTSTGAGYLTNYTYDALGNLTGVTQNAQPGGTTQTRSYTFDAMSRLTSETNAESVTTSYTYDSATGCTGTYSGDLVKRVDAVGNITCNTYDLLHRLLTKTYTVSSPTVATPKKVFVYDTATVNGTAMTNVKGRLAEAYTCTTCPGTKITDEGFSYTSRGEVSDVYQLTPHSSPSYYHVAQTYWLHGAPSQLSSTIAGVPITGLPTINYGGTIGSTMGLDGEGRITQVTAGTGQQPPVTATAYNTASLPSQVTFGSGDVDIFGYDSNTLRMNSYQFKIGTQSVTGTLGWNANASLGTLGIVDQLNSANTQNCSYAADDLSRITKADCGTIWGQTFSYDPFGNVTKNKIAGSGASSFTPIYQNSPQSNRVSSVLGVSATYDANGNSTYDTFRSYTWDADSNSVSIGSANLTFDALDRMVEQSVGSTNSEIVYGPGGGKLALMNGTILLKAFVPLTGGATAVYTSSGLAYYRHTDHLGTSRLASTPTQTVYSDTAYSAFGEPYASSGAIDNSFTGQNQDTTAGLYDFLFREQDPNQGRWASPDPAGLAAVDPSNPQSWNRYAYVLNKPLALIDPLGLDNDCGGPCFSFSYIDANGCLVTVTYFKVRSNGATYDYPKVDIFCPVSQNSTGGPGGGPPNIGGGGGGNSAAVQAATQYCRDNGHIFSFKIPGSNIPVTLDPTATAGPFKYGSTNDIQTVIPLTPWGLPAGAGVGYTLKINAPKDPAPQLSYGIQNGLSAGVFIRGDGTHQGSVFSFGLGIGPLYSLVLPTTNACGLREQFRHD